MEKTNISQATPENQWAEIREILREVGERNRELTEKQAETDRQMKETDRLIKDIARQQKDTARQQKDTARQMKDTDRRIKKVSETLGSWANNQGSFAEEYFFNSFKRGKKNFFGEKFDKIERNVQTYTSLDEKIADEYDILLINGKSIGIIEVKYKAHKNDIPLVMKKAETFRINYPKYANHQVYLGLATMAFSPKLEQVCINKGIAIIKQVGDTVVINDEHLKVF